MRENYSLSIITTKPQLQSNMMKMVNNKQKSVKGKESVKEREKSKLGLVESRVKFFNN